GSAFSKNAMWATDFPDSFHAGTFLRVDDSLSSQSTSLLYLFSYRSFGFCCILRTFSIPDVYSTVGRGKLALPRVIIQSN
ncbi:MAG: hypothetical protein KAG66_18340, partial [Methylococcales bacterium]|nr:hypothetical protein [Methylococcales bacterium]